MDISLPCPACGDAALAPFYRVASIPVHSCVLVETREAALAFPQGDLELAFCEAVASSRIACSIGRGWTTRPTMRRRRGSRRVFSASSTRSATTRSAKCPARQDAVRDRLRQGRVPGQPMRAQRLLRHRHRPGLPAGAHASPGSRPPDLHPGFLRPKYGPLAGRLCLLPAHARAYRPTRDFCAWCGGIGDRRRCRCLLRAARHRTGARRARLLGHLLRALLVLHARARSRGCSARTGFEVTRQWKALTTSI